MKIFLAQQNYHIGNFEANTAKIIAAIKEAKKLGGDLVVFSELAVCGYPPRDFLEFNDFVEQCLASIDKIREVADTIGVLVGCPARNERPEGKDLFNSAYLLHEKEIKGIVHKSLLPNYDIFDEYRYFEPAFEWNVLHFKGKKLAVTICEDIWDLVDDPLYRVRPMDMLIKQQPDIMINLSASPFDYVHADGRKGIVKQNVLKYQLPMVYCNTIGSQTEIIFDGGSLVMNFVTLENLATATATLQSLEDVEWDVLQLQAARSKPILHMHRMAAENPVWIVCARRAVKEARDD
jgi:NAD+ synthase (glutamine-hydrolysing)